MAACEQPVTPDEHIRAILALHLQQQELERTLARVRPDSDPDAHSRLVALKGQVDGILAAQAHVASFAHYVCIAIGAFRAGMLDEEIEATATALFRQAAGPYRVDLHA